MTRCNYGLEETETINNFDAAAMMNDNASVMMNDTAMWSRNK
jgi:hypothetical protein